MSNIIAQNVVISTNGFSQLTNYIASNFTPISGQIKMVISNNWMFGISDHSTNALFQVQP